MIQDAKAKTALDALEAWRKDALRGSVADLVFATPGTVQERVTNLIKSLGDEEVAALPYLCEPRGGMNLAGVIVEIFGHGWGGRYDSLLRKLAKTGFDLSVQQANGRYPALEAVSKDINNLHEDDFQWAFRHGLNPLAVYPDTHVGQSLLSVDVSHFDPELPDFLGRVIRRRVKRLSPEDRVKTIERLRPTVLPVYEPLMAELTRTALAEKIKPQARTTPTRRHL